MKKIVRNAGSILLIAMMSILVFCTAALAAEAVSVKLPVTMKLSSYHPSTPEELVLVLTAKDETCPMPEGSVDGVYKKTVSGEGVKEFPEIVFPKVGIHEYTIHQEKGTHTRGTYDSTVYKVTIFVTNTEDGGLATTTVSYVDGVAEKQNEMAFSNSYRRPSSGGGGGGSSSKPDPTQPTTSIVDNDTPLDDGNIITDIIDSIPPLATLPQTGTLWWLVPILACAGVLMFVTGLYKNRSSRNDEE